MRSIGSNVNNTAHPLDLNALAAIGSLFTQLIHGGEVSLRDTVKLLKLQDDVTADIHTSRQTLKNKQLSEDEFSSMKRKVRSLVLKLHQEVLHLYEDFSCEPEWRDLIHTYEDNAQQLKDRADPSLRKLEDLSAQLQALMLYEIEERCFHFRFVNPNTNTEPAGLKSSSLCLTSALTASAAKIRQAIECADLDERQRLIGELEKDYAAIKVAKLYPIVRRIAENYWENAIAPWRMQRSTSSFGPHVCDHPRNYKELSTECVRFIESFGFRLKSPRSVERAMCEYLRDFDQSLGRALAHGVMPMFEAHDVAVLEHILMTNVDESSLVEIDINALRERVVGVFSEFKMVNRVESHDSTVRLLREVANKRLRKVAKDDEAVLSRLRASLIRRAKPEEGQVINIVHEVEAQSDDNTSGSGRRLAKHGSVPNVSLSNADCVHFAKEKWHRRSRSLAKLVTALEERQHAEQNKIMKFVCRSLVTNAQSLLNALNAREAAVEMMVKTVKHIDAECAQLLQDLHAFERMMRSPSSTRIALLKQGWKCRKGFKECFWTLEALFPTSREYEVETTVTKRERLNSI